tara:strand:- start:13211 stop:13510 length:300 start_codon:yes stop_codon:yes gene_type:complete
MATIDYCENGKVIQIDKSDPRHPSNDPDPLPVDDENTASIIKEEELRAKRNTELMDTDWTQLPDVPDAIKNKYTTYRQQLRDLPSVDGFPDVDMPTKPE